MKEQKVQDFFVDLLEKSFVVVCHNQTEPDGNSCAICYSKEHYAFKCRFNAFNRYRETRK